MSLGELRAALDGIGGLTAEARAHTLVAAERLSEAARILEELTARAGTDLPAEHLSRAREEVDDVAVALYEAGELIGGLGAGL
ncbi:hypothetical protein [Pseudonocardia oroxyli]|uniref:Uncharacterized protein n=1 Tax=Pseudonocardia oroxyli TaxID=366584 RepID=A0A1G7NFP4_PSEOR|nr:hypothetical protein [Pseudonocardia oroxyli]SDF72874.1 hypothetical protein SAMN05216377_106231 [Pseudonocardia oroxyli]